MPKTQKLTCGKHTGFKNNRVPIFMKQSHFPLPPTTPSLSLVIECAMILNNLDTHQNNFQIPLQFSFLELSCFLNTFT